MKALWNIIAVLLFSGLYCQTEARIGFYSPNEYRYEYVGQVLTGLPNVANDKSAVAIAATVVIQPESNYLIVQLEDPKFFNGKVSDVINVHAEVPLTYQSPNKPELKLPFKIVYKGNTDEFHGIETSNDDPNWYPSETFEPIDIFETGVEGKCSTKYIYRSVPFKHKTFNVTKFRDVSKCQDTLKWKRTILEPLKCSGCDPQKENFGNAGTVASYTVQEENNQYTITSGQQFSQSDFSQFLPKGDIFRITQFQRFNLKGVSKSYKRINFSSSRSVSHTVMGILSDDIAEVPTRPRYKRQLTKTGSIYTKISPLKKPALKLDSKETIRKLVNELETESNTGKIPDLRKVADIVEQIRLLNQDEIEQLYNLFDSDQTGSNRRVLDDFVVMAGTDSAVLFIKKLIEENKIRGEHANNIVSNIGSYILEPKPDILEGFWNLCKTQLVKESRQLYVTTLLTFGELVNQACVPKEEPKTIKPFHARSTGCSSLLTSRFLQEITRQFDQTPEVWEKVTLALTLMRMGLNNTIDYIAPLLQQKYMTYSPSVRTVLLMSLYETGPGREADIVKYIMPIFYNSSLTVEERVIAVDIVAYTTTSQSIMNQIAMSTWNEPNTQIHSYIYSYLIAVSKITQTCWAPMALRSRNALTLAKPIDIGAFDTQFSAFNNLAEQWGLASMFGYAATFTPRAAFPKILYFNVANQMTGYFYSAFESMLFTSGWQKTLDYLTGPQSYYFNDFKFSDIFSGEPRKDAKFHQEEIDLKTRQYEPQNVFWMFTYLGTRHRLFFLDDRTITDFKQLGMIPQNKDLYSAVRDGISVDINKYSMLADEQTKMTSIIGIPLTIEIKVPVHIRARGNISLELTKSGNALSSFSIKPEFDTAITLKGWIDVQADVPFTNTKVGTEVVTSTYISFPFYNYFNIDLTLRSITNGWRYPKPKDSQEKTFLKYTIEPINYVYSSLTNDKVKYPITKTDITKNKKVTEVEVGIFGKKTKVTTQVDMLPSEYHKFKHESEKEGLLHSLSFWWALIKFNQRSYEISYQTPDANTDQIEFKINWQSTPSPLQEELWRGKSSLQTLRTWNLQPEWTQWPLPCEAISTTIPYKPPTVVETTTKRSWFSRFKDKVKSTFGRSGGDDDESAEDDKDDDKDDAEDRGRALNPHLVSNTGSGTSGDSHSSFTNTGQTRSGQVSGQHGQTYDGGDYSQSRYGSSFSESEYSQSQYGGSYGGQEHSQSQYGSNYGGQDYSQTQYGGQYGGGQSQYGGGQYGGGQSQHGEGTGFDDDFSQKTSRVDGGYAPGTGSGYKPATGSGYIPGTGSGQTYPYRPSTGDRVIKPKPVVKPLNFKDETSTTLVAVQMNMLGYTKRQINADITIVDNSYENSKKMSVSLDFNNIIPQYNTFKVCLTSNSYNLHHACPTQLNRDGADSDVRLQWGTTCDNTNYVNYKINFNLGHETSKLFDELKLKWNIKPNSYVPMTGQLELQNSIQYNQELHDVTYSPSLLRLFPNVSTWWEKHMCQWSSHLTANIVGNYAEEGRLVMQKNYKDSQPYLDAEIKSSHFYRKYENIYYPPIGPHVFPQSPFNSYFYRFDKIVTRGKSVSVCAVLPSRQSIKTFNGVIYNFTTEECEHVIVKDCSPSHMFTVTATGKQNKFQKITIQLLEHKLIFNPSTTRSGSGLEFELDGQKQILQKGQLAVVRSQGYDDLFLATISSYGPRLIVKSAFMGFVFTFDQDQFTTVLLRVWQGKACGLCGEFSGEEELTFVSPNQCLYNDPQSFANTYFSNKCSRSVAPGLKQGYCRPLIPLNYSWSPNPHNLNYQDITTGSSLRSTRSPLRKESDYYPYGSIGQTGDDGYDQPGPFDQQQGGFNPHVQKSGQDFDDYNLDGHISRITKNTSEVIEEPIKPVTYKPAGSSGDEGGCIVRRNVLKRLVDQVKGTRIKKLCFSTEPIRQCRRTCAGVNLTPETVHFKCYNEPNLTAEKWANEINDRPLPEIVTTDYDFGEELMVAQDCYPQY
ncbi:hypothetical protein CHUAL_012586 [Chamberlinius hualienensis]